jgi:hypothetical protein
MWPSEALRVIEIPSLPAANGWACVPAQSDAPAPAAILPLPDYLRPGPRAIVQLNLCLCALRDRRAGYRVGGQRPLQRGLSGQIRDGHLTRVPAVGQLEPQVAHLFRNCFRTHELHTANALTRLINRSREISGPADFSACRWRPARPPVWCRSCLRRWRLRTAVPFRRC